MNNLRELVNNYLNENGIKTNYFAKCIGCEYTKCVRWLDGKTKLNIEQLERVHDFLNGKYLKTVNDIVNGKEEG